MPVKVDIYISIYHVYIYISYIRVATTVVGYIMFLIVWFIQTVDKKDGSNKVVDKDEGIRVPIDYKKMAALPTPFKQNG